MTCPGVTPPGGTDGLYIVTTIMIIVTTDLLGALFFWLHFLPGRMEHRVIRAAVRHGGRLVTPAATGQLWPSAFKTAIARKVKIMSQSIDDLLPSAKSLAEKIALSQAEEARRLEEIRKAAEAEQKAFIDHLAAPSGVSDEEGIRRAVRMIERATSKGMTMVQVHRFPNALCNDHGRAINQGEKGWEKTLTGVPLRSTSYGTNISGPRDTS